MNHKNKRLALSVMLLCIALGAGGVLFGCGSKAESAAGEAESAAEQAETAAESETEQETEAGLEFPMLLEDDRLTVNSLFQSTILNPDAGDQEGTDIASLEVVNTSDEYIERAEIELTLDDGKKCSFLLEGLPAGRTAWLFDTENQSIGTSAVCESVKCSSSTDEADPLMSDSVSVEIEGTQATFTNLTDSELSGLTVQFHGLMDDIYFGGTVYTYDLEPIAAGGSTTVDVVECYLGMAEAVQITKTE